MIGVTRRSPSRGQRLRHQRQLDAAARERVERALDEALGAAVRRVPLADDREAHQGA